MYTNGSHNAPAPVASIGAAEYADCTNCNRGLNRRRTLRGISEWKHLHNWNLYCYTDTTGWHTADDIATPDKFSHRKA